jgi:flavodoxin I
MSHIAILYGTSGGNTESVAKSIRELFDNDADLYNVEAIKIDDIKPYKYLILGTSTTGIGDLQDDWDSFLPVFSKADLSDKTVAIFTLGDSASFSSSFAEAMKVIYDAIKDKTKVVGFVDDEGYTYDDSTAVVDGRWVGLPVDEDNEYDQTDARLKAWVEELKKEFI